MITTLSSFAKLRLYRSSTFWELDLPAISRTWASKRRMSGDKRPEPTGTPAA